MMRVWLGCLAAAIVAFPAAPDSLDRPASTTASPGFNTPISDDPLPSQATFEQLARTDPIAFFDAARSRLRREVRTFQCTLVKQERVNGSLNNPETIKLIGRAEPFSVLMIWQQGARTTLGNTTRGTLYVAGLNEGRIKVWIETLFGGNSFISVSPVDDLARKSSRFAITEGGLLGATDRAREAWAEARDRHPETWNEQWRFVGKQPVPELDGKLCYILERDCNPPELSLFATGDAPRNPAEFPEEAYAKIRVIFDVETWIQLGSVLHRADGELIGYYYFKDLQINPVLPANQFTVEALR